MFRFSTEDWKWELANVVIVTPAQVAQLAANDSSVYEMKHVQAFS